MKQLLDWLLDWLLGCHRYRHSIKVGKAWRTISIPGTKTLAAQIVNVEVDVSVSVSARPRLPFIQTRMVRTHSRLCDPVAQPGPFGGVAAITQWLIDVDPQEVIDGYVIVHDLARRAADNLRDRVVANREKESHA